MRSWWQLRAVLVMALVMGIFLLGLACSGTPEAGQKATAAPAAAAQKPATAVPQQATAAPAAAAAKDAPAYPTKEIEFVTQTGAGGSSDIFMRQVAQMLKTQGIITHPIVFNNKSGGSGAVAMKFLQQERMGDGHSLWTISGAGLLSNVARGVVSLDVFHPVAVMAVEPQAIVASASSKFKSIEDIIAAAKQGRKTVNLAGAAVGGGGHLAGTLLGRTAGVEFNFISFQSGKEALMSVLGGHADFVIESPGEVAELVRSGQMKLLATTGSQKLGIGPDAPTLAEKGFANATYEIARGFLMMKGVKDYEAVYWENAFKKLVDTKEWKDYALKDNIDTKFLAAADCDKFLRSQYDVMLPVIKELGLDKAN